MALVGKTLEGLKDRLKAWKGALESKGSRINVKKTKKMISSENGQKVAENKFPCAISRKGVGSNSILWPFCRCWVHKRYSGTRGKLKVNSKFN